MKIYSLIKVKETHQTWSEEDDFVLEKPNLKVAVSHKEPHSSFKICNAENRDAFQEAFRCHVIYFQAVGNLQVNRLGQIEVSFTNPLDVTLTRCHVSVECAGVVRQVRERVGEVGPKENFTHKVMVMPRKEVGKSDTATLVATFGSEEMIDVFGSCSINVGV